MERPTQAVPLEATQRYPRHLFAATLELVRNLSAHFAHFIMSACSKVLPILTFRWSALTSSDHLPDLFSHLLHRSAIATPAPGRHRLPLSLVHCSRCTHYAQQIFGHPSDANVEDSARDSRDGGKGGELCFV